MTFIASIKNRRRRCHGDAINLSPGEPCKPSSLFHLSLSYAQSLLFRHKFSSAQRRDQLIIARAVNLFVCQRQPGAALRSPFSISTALYFRIPISLLIGARILAPTVRKMGSLYWLGLPGRRPNPGRRLRPWRPSGRVDVAVAVTVKDRPLFVFFFLSFGFDFRAHLSFQMFSSKLRQ